MSKRATKQGQQYKKNRRTNTQQPKKEEGMSTATKVVIGVFAVLMALSMSGVFSMFGNIAGGNSSASNTAQLSTIEDVDNAYQPIADQYEEKVAADPTDMASTRSLAQAYMNWGYNVSYLATVDAETSHANELFAKAMALYDTYIASNPEDVGQAKVDRALCQLYSGETTAALSALQDITTEDPTNAIAWANLGLLYEITGDTDSAIAAYDSAIANDPDNAQGAKSYASSRRLSLANGGTSEGLPSTLRDLSDTSI